MYLFGGEFMKKFTKILICLAICFMCMGMVACGKKDNFVYPTAVQTTYSNGGLAVKKGNYLYFVNGYQSASSMVKKNADYTVGALMIAKLDAAGNLVVDENGLLKDDFYRTMSSKLCGFEATNLYVFGDYLYFASPSQEDEADRNVTGGETWAKTRVVFYRVKLNKTGKVEKLYTSEVSNTNLQYCYYSYNNSTFLLAFEKGDSIEVKDDTNNRLLRVDAESKKVFTIAKDVVDVVMPTQDVANAHENVFYTLKGDNGKMKLHQLNVVTGEDNSFELENDVTLVCVANGRLFYTKTQKFAGGTDLCYFEIAGNVYNAEHNCVSNVQLFTNYYIAEDGETFVGINSTSIEIRWKWWASNGQTFVCEEAGANFIGFAGASMIYYDENNNIKALDCTQKAEPVTIATVENVDTAHFDCNWDYLYFYKTVGSNNYLHRLRINNNAELVKEELVGVLLNSDIPEKESD